MPKDTRGIYQYTEADDEATFSELMNLGMQSVSTALAYFAGTMGKRITLDPAPPGAMWKDTDGTHRLWSTSPHGTWRQHEGIGNKAATAWELTSGGISGRSFNIDIPTVLGPDETVAVTHIGPTGFVSYVSLDGVTRFLDRTQLTLRHLQFLNGTNTPCKFAWRVVAAGEIL